MAVGIAILNHKGGTGKTSVTTNLAGALAYLGKRVLALDLAPHADLTISLGFKEDVYAATGYNIQTLLVKNMDPNPLIRSAPP